MARRKKGKTQSRQRGKTTVAAPPAERPHAPRRRLPVWKKLLLSLVVTLVFFALLELVLVAFGVQPRWYESDPYVGFSSYAPLFVEERQSDGSVDMVRAANKARLFNLQRFPKDKGRRSFRVFCVGGSTTYGRPYGDGTSFCGWLRGYLAVAEPTREWEVINAGGVSYASYRVAMLMEELVRYQPDLFVIYSGHNEFLERRTYSEVIAMPKAVRGLGSVLSRTRTWVMVERGVQAVRRSPEAGTGGGAELGSEVETLLDASVGPEAYSRDDELSEQIVSHYRFNLARMVDIARSAGAGVILVAPASNLRHCRPFKNEQRSDLGDDERVQVQTLVTVAKSAHAAGLYDDALSALAQALAIDDRNAHISFMAGQVLDELGRHEEAMQAFARARDEDVCPLRALGEMDGVVREVAAARDVPLVDFVALVSSRAAQGIPGRDVFLDHVHPTIGANRLLALALLEQMRDMGLVHPTASWGADAVARVAERVEASIDPASHGSALMNLSKVLGWAGKLEEADRLAQQAVELAPDEAAVHCQAGLTANLLGDVERAMEHYQRAIELDPGAALPYGNLGVALEREGRLSEATAHYRHAIELGNEDDRRRNTENLAVALVRLGYQTYVEGRHAESVRHLSEAARLDPGNADTLDKLGVALLATNRVEEAVQQFRTVLEVVPENAAVRNRLAVALAYAGKSDEAREHFLMAVRDSPSIAGSPNSLVLILERLGRHDEAAQLRRLVVVPAEPVAPRDAGR